MRRSIGFFLACLAIAGCAKAPAALPTSTAVSDPEAFEAPAPVPTLQPGAHGPVLLVHGHDGSAADWDTMLPWLKQEGFQPKALTFMTDDWNIANLADQVGVYVEAMCQETHQEKIDVVAHSIGGLATRWYIKYKGGDKHINHLVCLSSPHHGIGLASPGRWLEIARELTPGSHFLDTLNRPEETEPGISYTCIWSTGDWTQKFPRGSGRLKGAFNFKTGGIAHSAMTRTPKLFPYVEAGLLRPMDANPGAEQVIE